MSDRAEFLRSLLTPLPAQLEQDPAGQASASVDFGAVCAAYIGGRCGRADVLRAAAACHMRRPLPSDIGELVAAELCCARLRPSVLFNVSRWCAR